LDLAAIIDDNETYSVINSNIKETLARAFKSATNYSTVFEPFVNMFLENKMLGE
jgi:hypothetical protein